MEQCRNAGIFNPKRIRGRGCWNDEGKTVVHLGDKLLVDGEDVELNEMDSTYVYQASGKKVKPSNPLSNEEAKGILDVTKSLNWSIPASGLLLAGFCALAPVCGLIPWRPHILINGGTGSGKSTVTDGISRKLIGDTVVAVSLTSSVSGLRQVLKKDAYPVIIEEFDPEGKNGQAKSIEFFDMMRDASGDSETPTLRGSPNGTAVEYPCNSMFHLVAIQVCTDVKANLNRISVLSLKSNSNKKDPKASDEKWQNIQKLIDKNITSIDNIGSRLLARTLENIDIIKENIKTFKKAAHKHFGNARDADQYGTLLAGAYSLYSDCLINEKAALIYIQGYDWDEYTEGSSEDDSMNALNSILQSRLTIQGGLGMLSLTAVECIEAVRREEIDYNHINRELRRFGIVCRDDHFIITNNSPEMQRALSLQNNPPWAKNWKIYLQRITDDNGDRVKTTKGPISFNRSQQRGTCIPYDIVFKDEDNEY